MPETNKPGERGDEDYGTPGLNGHDPATKDLSAEFTGGPSLERGSAPEGEPEPVEKGPEEPAEAALEASLSEFADDVVSGLEHVGLGAEEREPLDQAGGENGGELPEGSDTFFAEWGSFGTGQQGTSPAQQQAESFISPESPAPSLNALSLMGLAGYAESGGTSALGPGKHEELADAVQSALFSIYGEIAHQSAEREYSNAAPGGGASSSMSWNKGLKADFTPSNGDGLSPQDVILNYFDYNTPGSNGSMQGFAPAAQGRVPPYEDPLPNFVRSRPEPAAQQRNWAAQDYPSYRPERAQAETNTAQYDGPPAFSYPVPAATPAASRVGGRTGQESSKLLGAAAIGLMGGIAIAASLAAFLIYGPRPASVEIPGIGNLRIDKDEQGYGQAVQEEAGREPQKVATVKSGQEFSSELVAADAAATPGQPAPLAISIRSQQPFEKTLVSISGLPEGGRLNAGVDTGGGNWLLPPRRLSGLAISLPAGAPDVVPIQVQLLDSNARTPLSAKAEFVIRVRSAAGTQIASAGTAAPPLRPAQAPSASLNFNTQTLPQAPAGSPASGGTAVQTAPSRAADLNFRAQTVPALVPPTFQPAPAPGTSPGPQEQAGARRANPRPEVEDLIREGNKRMREGDILEARQFYQKAVALGDAAGDAEAALAMGRSYDPIYFARIDKKNAEPDAAKAFEWYRKARDAGAVQTAMVRIENLKHFLNE
jgi:hypothetical protein